MEKKHTHTVEEVRPKGEARPRYYWKCSCGRTGGLEPFWTTANLDGAAQAREANAAAPTQLEMF